ncbi:MAG: hypothetical protein WBB69_07685 [Anaerolineales bacterium]
MIFPAGFALIVGFGMIAQWILSYTKKQIPELHTEPIRIWFHIAGELATALFLIFSGIGLLADSLWAPTLFFIAMGMLIYTAIVSPGYFAQRGHWIWVVIFGILIAISIGAIITVAGGLPG